MNAVGKTERNQTGRGRSGGSSRFRAGFTLTELMVVIVIVVVLAGLVFVGAAKARQSARSASNINVLRQCSIAIMQFSAESQKYPRAWNNGQSFPGAGSEWYEIPSIRQALGDATPEGSDNLAVSQRLMSPSVPIRGEIPGRHPVVNHYALSMGPANKHPAFNPPLRVSAVRRPEELILLADTGTSDGRDFSDGQQHLWQLNEFSTGDANDPDSVDMRSKGSGWAKMDFDRHGNEKVHVVFCDGHVEARGMDEFYRRNFQPR